MADIFLDDHSQFSILVLSQTDIEHLNIIRKVNEVNSPVSLLNLKEDLHFQILSQSPKPSVQMQFNLVLTSVCHTPASPKH